MFQLGHFVPKSFTHFLYNTIMGVAKWERDLWWLSLFLWKCEVRTILTISNWKTPLCSKKYSGQLKWGLSSPYPWGHNSYYGRNDNVSAIQIMWLMLIGFFVLSTYLAYLHGWEFMWIKHSIYQNVRSLLLFFKDTRLSPIQVILF